MSEYYTRFGYVTGEDDPPTVKVKRCNQCASLYINGVFCHETGCPNQGKRWDNVEGEWVRYIECRECGSYVREGEECCQ